MVRGAWAAIRTNTIIIHVFCMYLECVMCLKLSLLTAAAHLTQWCLDEHLTQF